MIEDAIGAVLLKYVALPTAVAAVGATLIGWRGLRQKDRDFVVANPPSLQMRNMRLDDSGKYAYIEYDLFNGGKSAATIATHEAVDDYRSRDHAPTDSAGYIPVNPIQRTRTLKPGRMQRWRFTFPLTQEDPVFRAMRIQEKTVAEDFVLFVRISLTDTAGIGALPEWRWRWDHSRGQFVDDHLPVYIA